MRRLPFLGTVAAANFPSEAQSAASPRERGRSLRPLVPALLLLAAVAVWAQEKPTPTPTPSTLSDVARTIKLKLPPGTRKLDNDAVKRLGEGVVLTTAPNPASKKPPTSPASPQREAWQSRYQEARARVLGLELLVQRLEGQLRGGAGQGAEASILEKSLRRARTELELMRGAPENVQREALAAGGKAEWFANLPTPEPIFPSWVEQR